MPRQPNLQGANEALDLSSKVVQLQRQVDQSSSAEEDLPLSSVQPSPDQARKTFTEADIRERMASLESHGQISPIKVYEKDEMLWILDGEIRWRAANRLSWKTIRAVRVPEVDVFTYSLVDSLQDKSLCPYDRIHGVMRFVLGEVEFEPTESSKRASGKSGKPALHHEFMSSIRRLAKLGAEEPEDAVDAQVSSILFALGQSAASMSANDIPYLMLPSGLEEYIYKGLPGKLVLASKKIDDIQDRIDFLEDCLEQDLSASEASAALAEKVGKKPKKIKDPWVSEVEKLANVKIDSSNAVQVGESLAEKKTQLLALLSALESKITEANGVISGDAE